jgi:hypothetical protein
MDDKVRPTITFQCDVETVRTICANQGGGIRVTLNLPETAIMQAAQLIECKAQSIPLVATLTAGM